AAVPYARPRLPPSPRRPASGRRPPPRATPPFATLLLALLGPDGNSGKAEPDVVVPDRRRAPAAARRRSGTTTSGSALPEFPSGPSRASKSVANGGVARGGGRRPEAGRRGDGGSRGRA